MYWRQIIGYVTFAGQLRVWDMVSIGTGGTRTALPPRGEGDVLAEEHVEVVVIQTYCGFRLHDL